MHPGHAYEALLPKIEMECLRWPEKLLKLGGLESSGLMVSALDSEVSSPGSLALAWDIVLCSCTGDVNAGGNLAMDKHPIQGGVEILLVSSCYRNRDKLRPDGPQLGRMQT